LSIPTVSITQTLIEKSAGISRSPLSYNIFQGGANDVVLSTNFQLIVGIDREEIISALLKEARAVVTTHSFE
jgi:hypothetical protein